MFVKVADGKTREQQYLRALAALLDIADPVIGGITFIENTGANLLAFQRLGELRNIHQKKLEFISLDLNEYPRELGIGYGEFRLLDEGIRQSKLLAADSYIVKLTGRLIVRNLAAILRRLPSQFDMALDVYPGKDPSIGEVDSRLMVISPAFYAARIEGMYRQVNGSKAITAEHCLYQAVRRSAGARIIPRLPREPQWIGYSGSTGMRYDSLAMRLKYPPKAMIRALSRWINVPDLRPVWETATTSQPGNAAMS